MIKLGQNIYSNFKQSDIPQEKTNKVRAIVMGNCGAGKTSLFNLLCNTHKKINNQGGISQTRDIDYADVVYIQGKGSEKRFRLYDTPGADSTEDALDHALILRTSLTSLSINLIMVNVKFESRFSTIFKQIKKFLQIIKGYEKFVVCLMSHLDLLDTEKDKQQILSQMSEVMKKQLNNSFKLIFYSNKTTNPKLLSDILFRIGKTYHQQKIDISDQKFFKYFDISGPMNAEKIDKYIQKIKDEADKFFDTYNQIQGQIRKLPDPTESISDLRLNMKNQLKKVQEQQYQQYKKQFDERKTMDLRLAISQFIQSKLQEFEELTENNIPKTFYNPQTKSMTDIRDLIKECPKCKLIWMITQGNGTVTCGQKVPYRDTLILGQNFGQQGAQKGEKRVGCGYSFDWRTAPRSKGVEQRLKDLYRVGNYQEIKLEMNCLSESHQKIFKQLNSKLEKSRKKIVQDKQ